MVWFFFHIRFLRDIFNISFVFILCVYTGRQSILLYIVDERSRRCLDIYMLWWHSAVLVIKFIIIVLIIGAGVDVHYWHVGKGFIRGKCGKCIMWFGVVFKYWIVLMVVTMIRDHLIQLFLLSRQKIVNVRHLWCLFVVSAFINYFCLNLYD